MAHTNLARHESYNNRFRTSVSGERTTDPSDPHKLPSLSESVDIFGHTPNFGQLTFDGTNQDEHRNVERVSSLHESQATVTGNERRCSANSAGGRKVSQTQSDDPPKPMAPGQPRRLSRQISADTKRQMFAGTKLGSGDGRPVNTTSADSGCDDVFLDIHDGNFVHGAPQGKRMVEPTFSTSSTASILPNPYNRFNHRVHTMVWCCSCIYFVFFCCLPAIYYMEQSDKEYSKGNVKRARALGRASSFLFFTGTLLMLSMFALIFFFAIFFTVYY